MVSPIDNKGFAKWFGKSKVVDENGQPLIVFRGEYGEPEGDSFQSRLPSLSFGTLRAANIYALHPNNSRDVPVSPRIYPAYLKMERPFLENRADTFLDLSVVDDSLGREEALRIARKFSAAIQSTDNWASNFSRGGSVDMLLQSDPSNVRELYFDAYALFDDLAEVQRLTKLGYDGAIHIGNGETAFEIEYKVFRVENARSALFSARVNALPQAI